MTWPEKTANAPISFSKNDFSRDSSDSIQINPYFDWVGLVRDCQKNYKPNPIGDFL